MKEHRKVATFVLVAATVAIVLVGALVSNIHIIQKANGQKNPYTPNVNPAGPEHQCRDCTKINCSIGNDTKCTTVP